VNGYRWHAAAVEVAEWVRTTAPRVALAGGAIFLMVAVALLVRYYVYLPRFGV